MKNFAQLQHKFLDPTTPHTNPPQPTRLITINLKFFKKIMFFNQIVVILFQKFICFQVLFEV
jgi:hypothetical protein